MVKNSLCPSTKHWMSLEPSISSTLIAMCCILSRYAGAVLDSVLESEMGRAGRKEERRQGEKGGRGGRGRRERGRGRRRRGEEKLGERIDTVFAVNHIMPSP